VRVWCQPCVMCAGKCVCVYGVCVYRYVCVCVIVCVCVVCVCTGMRVCV